MAMILPRKADLAVVDLTAIIVVLLSFLKVGCVLGSVVGHHFNEGL